MKKIIITIVVVFVSGLLVAVFAQKKKAVPTPAPVTKTPGPKYSQVGLSTGQKGAMAYFNVADKSFYLNANKIITLDYEPLTVLFSQNLNTAAVIGDAQNILKPIQLFNLQERSGWFLDPKIMNLAFSPEGDKMVYHRLLPADKTSKIEFSALTGQNPKTIYEPEFEDGRLYALRWPWPNSVFVFPISSDITRVSLAKIDLLSDKYEDIYESYILDVLPSPSLNILAVIEDNPNAGQRQLSIIDSNGNLIKQIKLETTSQQTSWNKKGDRLYVFGNYNGAEGLYRLDKNGNATILQKLSLDTYSISYMAISDSEKELYIINKGKLETIALP